MRPVYVLDFLPTYVLRELRELAGAGCRPVVVMPSDSPLAAYWDGISGADEGEMERTPLPFRGLMICGARRLLGRSASPLLRALLRSPLRTLSLTRQALETGCFRYLCAGAMLAESLREAEADLLHAHFAQDAAHVASWAASLLGLPFTVTTHARDIFVPQSANRLRQVLESADAVVTISEFNAAFIEDLLGPEISGKTRVIRLGVDAAALPPRAETTGGEICIASGLAEKKGVHILLETARMLRERGRELSCTVIGGDSDGRRLDSYRKAVEGGRLSVMLDFPGVLDSEETLSRLASASLCVLPSVRARDGDMDGIPVCLMEAAAMGVPIVSTRLSGIPELVVHGETGLLADPGDPGSLADSLQWAADHPAEMERMAARGRERVAEMFDSAASARAVLSMMEETAGRREP